MAKRMSYPLEIRLLSDKEGGGFLIFHPDFLDCPSDGKTVEEALTNGKVALKTPIAVLKAKMQPTPVPNSGGVASGKFVARVPNLACAPDNAREGRGRVTECWSLRSSRKGLTQRAGRISTNKPQQLRVFPPETRVISVAPRLGYHQPDDRPPPTPNSSLSRVVASQSWPVF